MVWYLNSLTLIMIMLFSVPLSAYPTPIDFNGKLSRWDIKSENEPILYRIDADDAYAQGLAPIVAEAAAQWSEVPHSYFRFKAADEGETEQVTLYFESSLDGAPYSSGYAMFDELDSELRPKHCEIHIDINQGGLPKTILHEMGHCVGLGHSVVPESIMSYDDNKNVFGLDTDDAAAVSRLYPASSSHAKLPPGCSVGSGDRPSQLSLLVSLLIMMIPLLLPLSFR